MDFSLIAATWFSQDDIRHVFAKDALQQVLDDQNHLQNDDAFQFFP